MKSVMVEYQRFGGVTGILAEEARYLRTVSSGGPAAEVSFGLRQQLLSQAMQRLDYGNYRTVGDPDRVRAAAERVLQQLGPVIGEFLPCECPGGADGPYQVEVVTRAFELAQLPFEVLERDNPDVIVTRRIRQAWPRPTVVRGSNPRILFAWAAPKFDPNASQRMEVPHERHLELLEALLRDWGGSATDALDVLPHATRAGLAERVAREGGYTHVHLLAHGVGPSASGDDLIADLDFGAEPDPTTFLALEADDGGFDRCSPQALAEMFQGERPRPASFAVATCESGKVESIEAGGTLAHALHEVGIPVVLASQFALTQAGSDELISTFLSEVIDGEDPRGALRDCRNALDERREETYYDRVALVGYIHLEEDFEDQLPRKRFEVALARLEAASRFADQRVHEVLEKKGQGDQTLGDLDLGDLEERFAGVRRRLEKMPRAGLTKRQLEELHGLQASSLKREAESAWGLAQALAGEADKAAETWRARSRDALGEAVEAYARAARTSRDHHWTWVQWLALVATVGGDLAGHEEDWVVARVASRDHAEREPDEGMKDGDRRRVLEEAIWARGSLAELYLLAPLTGTKRVEAPLERAKRCLDELVERCRTLGIEFPIDSTLRQLARYDGWWGADDHWKLPAEVRRDAKLLHAHLTRLKKDK